MSFYDLENLIYLKKLKMIVLNKNYLDIINFEYFSNTIKHINLDDNPIVLL